MDNHFQKEMEHFGAWQEIQQSLKKRSDDYDEKFFASIGVHKVNGKYDPNDLKMIDEHYVKNYYDESSGPTMDSEITLTAGCRWEARDENKRINRRIR